MPNLPLYPHTPNPKAKAKEQKEQRDERLQKSRWLRALGIAKILFEDEGYHTQYLREIEQFIKDRR